ncbi:hypothetical protein SAY87_017561 [Trapa incisa]|uniref:DUF7815 domain-containing protein n=1 Tax=Trapa incisa TaxID=236973 RepID=A0AAN7L4J4_9MYRT|nr:hypothetical protein SAY87_017561 [Trapa incisa]
MPYPIPLDTIHQLQISLRKEAKIPSYDPTDPQLPKFPSLEQSISQLEPSPSYMRCKHCKGRLIRGIKSLFCVFCGKDQFGEIPPDPINFRSTTGHSWLLESLQLDGSVSIINFSCNLIVSAPASTASVNENENGNDSSQSSWAAAFQFASSEAANKESTSVDLFPSSQADISMHVDTMISFKITQEVLAAS